MKLKDIFRPGRTEPEQTKLELLQRARLQNLRRQMKQALASENEPIRRESLLDGIQRLELDLQARR